jgi:hypothetical protein
VRLGLYLSICVCALALAACASTGQAPQPAEPDAQTVPLDPQVAYDRAAYAFGRLHDAIVHSAAVTALEAYTGRLIEAAEDAVREDAIRFLSQAYRELAGLCESCQADLVSALARNTRRLTGHTGAAPRRFSGALTANNPRPAVWGDRVTIASDLRRPAMAERLFSECSPGATCVRSHRLS